MRDILRSSLEYHVRSSVFFSGKYGIDHQVPWFRSIPSSLTFSDRSCPLPTQLRIGNEVWVYRVFNERIFSIYPFHFVRNMFTYKRHRKSVLFLLSCQNEQLSCHVDFILWFFPCGSIGVNSMLSAGSRVRRKCSFYVPSVFWGKNNKDSKNPMGGSDRFIIVWYFELEDTGKNLFHIKT